MPAGAQVQKNLKPEIFRDVSPIFKRFNRLFYRIINMLFAYNFFGVYSLDYHSKVRRDLVDRTQKGRSILDFDFSCQYFVRHF
jgi:hypothetical protein